MLRTAPPQHHRGGIVLGIVPPPSFDLQYLVRVFLIKHCNALPASLGSGDHNHKNMSASERENELASFQKMSASIPQRA